MYMINMHKIISDKIYLMIDINLSLFIFFLELFILFSVLFFSFTKFIDLVFNLPLIILFFKLKFLFLDLLKGILFLLSLFELVSLF